MLSLDSPILSVICSRIFPSFNKIRRIIELIALDYNQSDDELSEEHRIASIIRLAQEYDILDSKGFSKGEIFEKIRLSECIFLPGGIDALANSRELCGGFMEASQVAPADLKPGMRLMEELRLEDGKMLPPLGAIISLPFMQTIQSHLAALGDSVFPHSIEVLA